MNEINLTQSQRNPSTAASPVLIRRSGNASIGNVVNALEYSSMEANYVILVARGVKKLESETRMSHQSL